VSDDANGSNGNSGYTDGAPKRDPWEERERQRARYNRSDRSDRSDRGSSRGKSSSGGGNSAPPLPEESYGDEGLNPRENYLPFGLVVSVVLLLLAEIPRIPGGTRTLLAQVGTTLILLLLGTCRGFLENMWQALRRGPNPLIVALVVWAGVGFFISPHRVQAAAEMLRVVAGVGAYFLAAYTLRTPRQISYVIMGLLGTACAIALYDFAQTGQVEGGYRSTVAHRYSIFGTHENTASLLVLMLPAALAFAVHNGIREKQRLVALGTTVILGGALLVARTRSAWIGGVFALIMLAVLMVRYGGATTDTPDGGTGSKRRKSGTPLARMIGSPVVVVAIGFVVFVSVGGLAPFLSSRAGTLLGALEDSSLLVRIQMWDGAARMASERPLTGWGLGSYLIEEGRWTHLGFEMVQALKSGAGHENIAHNYYVQWAADTGGIGLLLYVGAVVAFALSVFRGLRDGTTVTPFQKALSCASLAAITGASVDAIASPAYNFHGVSTVFWVWMGLGVAALRAPSREGVLDATPSLKPTTLNTWVASLGTGALAAILVLGWGFRQRAVGRMVPRGVLQITAEPAGPAPPGSTITWTAKFKDENGKEISTMPGTQWDLSAEPFVMNRAQVTLGEISYSSGGTRYSVFRVLVPATNQPVSVRATFRDLYGRNYEAWSIKTVKPGAIPATIKPEEAPVPVN
jgi:O-antigen ligase